MIKLKVLFVSRIYPNEFSSNGRVFHSQAQELIKQGFEVKVISPIPFTPTLFKKHKKLWEEYSRLPNKAKYDGIDVYYPRYIKIPNKLLNKVTRKLSDTSFINAVMSVINREMESFEFDLVHCHMTYPDGLVGKSIIEKYKVPFVLSARSSDLDISINKGIVKDKMLQIYNLSDAIITPSPQLRQKLKENFNYDSTLIGNGIYPEKLKYVTNVDFNSENRNIILSVSNLMKTKGIQYNIKAMSKLVKEFPDLLYIVIGDGDYKNELVDLTSELNLMDHVVFLGNIDHYVAMQYMKKCDIFCLPSWRETFGLVYLEAMYFNKPVILCENQGIHGIVIDNDSCKVVKPHSEEEVYKSIKFLLLDKEKRDEISKKGNSLVKNHYTWEKIGDNLKDLYISVNNID
ncbi:Glycosyltransferase involved in cell wall bisynthesis [Gracilibacillus orientalis]|uniref:Glycosyltransferase involved in cell wall bisynthesis n=1 Tax=Gracilibacillus orientalis TaxID=334253 RepID=A0A1I4PDR2_9BACI|nr:glycosyltransferase family 4 protein [Gracilibacillus orientalis]SFM25858.1 Glycosyltransferase involved in cell wall bisynthesis [Gracilibacillus orientalis]